MVISKCVHLSGVKWSEGCVEGVVKVRRVRERQKQR
jgi:hypothetical protein